MKVETLEDQLRNDQNLSGDPETVKSLLILKMQALSESITEV